MLIETLAALTVVLLLTSNCMRMFQRSMQQAQIMKIKGIIMSAPQNTINTRDLSDEVITKIRPNGDEVIQVDLAGLSPEDKKIVEDAPVTVKDQMKMVIVPDTDGSNEVGNGGTAGTQKQGRYLYYSYK